MKTEQPHTHSQLHVSCLKLYTRKGSILHLFSLVLCGAIVSFLSWWRVHIGGAFVIYIDLVNANVWLPIQMAIIIIIIM